MLWNREDLRTLRLFASKSGLAKRGLPDGTQAGIERWDVRFPNASPNRLAEGTLRKTYTSKPLVAPFGESVFGEIGILRCLENDGWEGVWVDTFHGRNLFWRDMPHQSEPIDPAKIPRAAAEYNRIIVEHGRHGGFFDVLAWHNNEYLFIEYKGKGDRPISTKHRGLPRH